MSCGNQPPSVALQHPPALPRLPAVVDPDAWLMRYHLKLFRRSIAANGAVLLGSQRYYIQKGLVRQQAVLRLDAHARQFEVWVGGKVAKVHPIKGLVGAMLPLEAYIDYIIKEARSEEQRLRVKRR